MLFCYRKKKGVLTNFLVTTPNIIDPKDGRPLGDHLFLFVLPTNSFLASIWLEYCPIDYVENVAFI